MNCTAERLSYDLLGTVGPTLVKKRVVYADREVITAGLAPGPRAGWALCHVVLPDFAKFALDVVEDTKFPAVRAGVVSPGAAIPPLYTQLIRDTLVGDEATQFFFCHFAQALQVLHLLFERVVSAIKPISAFCSPMNAQWPPDRIAELAYLQFVLLGKDLDAFGESNAFDPDSQTKSEVVDVNPALPRQE